MNQDILYTVWGDNGDLEIEIILIGWLMGKHLEDEMKLNTKPMSLINTSKPKSLTQ